jgi:GrpB-like predicted nucleotidyltransferase (UPF0157 family)
VEQVYFLKQDTIQERAHEEFLLHKAKILSLLPHADIQHIGSTAIPSSITKGDLDIQVRVHQENFLEAVELLATLYDLNEGSTQTEFFRAFQNNSLPLPLGIQLTVIDSDLDIFWKIRDVLLANDALRTEYDHLKRRFEGKSMEEYRLAKSEFFEKMMDSI